MIFRLRILNMPSEELGAPAYKKYDIEAWMYAKKIWGEVGTLTCYIHLKYSIITFSDLLQ